VTCPGYRRPAHQTTGVLIPAATGHDLRLCRRCALTFSTDVIAVAARKEDHP
jgi:hypothetical protein